MTRQVATVVGISGPDGSGKTTLLRALRGELVASGIRVHTTYLYGCVFCRRARPAAGVDGGHEHDRMRGLLLRVHATVDLLELVIRLATVRLLASVEARSGRTAIVLADRTPLDGLAKHDVLADGVVGSAFRWAAGWFDELVLLDADAATLAARDGEHGPEELEGWRVRFRRAARSLPHVRRIDTTARSAGDVLAVILPLALPMGAAPAAGRASS